MELTHSSGKSRQSCRPPVDKTKRTNIHGRKRSVQFRLFLFRPSGNGINPRRYVRIYLFLLMTVLSESFLAFVGGHLVAFSFLSAWHNVNDMVKLIY